MRLATILEDGRERVGVVVDDRILPLGLGREDFGSMRAIAAGGRAALAAISAGLRDQPAGAWIGLDEVVLGPAVPNPGAIFAIGLNYGPVAGRPARPLVYAKLPGSVGGHGATLTWDRALTANVDAEVELAVVIGEPARAVTTADAMGHVFGYTCINDVSSRDAWLDGDQWLLGKSMPGFCPVGPIVVTADEIAPAELRLGCTINGIAIQDGSTADMRFSIAEIVSYLSRHVVLAPGDLIATGTPARLAGPMGPDRHLQAGDVATVWIEQIGELTVTIA